MKIWICIPVFNRKELTLNCLASLANQTYRNFTAVICDHGSTDGTSEAIQRQFPDAVVIKADNSLWWTGAINKCIEYALAHADREDTLLTMNNDNELKADYLEHLVINHNKYPNGIITSVIHDIKNGELISPGYRQNWLLATAYPVSFPNDHVQDDEETVQVTHASGRGALFPLEVFKKIGLFDEKGLPHYGADYDLAFKAARANYPIYSCLNCKVFSHIEETGMVKVLDKISVGSLLDYFTSIRSPANLKTRWRLGINNCPPPLLPWYLILDFIRVFGGYFKFFVSKKIAGHNHGIGK